MLKICEFCGRKYDTWDHRQKYCNRECFKNRMKGENNPAYKGKVKLTCNTCGNVYEVTYNRKDRSKYCSRKCLDVSLKGKGNPRYKGYMSFDVHAKKVDFADEVRRNPENKEAMQVKCTYCGKWFSPNKREVQQRQKSLWGLKYAYGESRFYCSNGCKKECPTFGQVLYPKGFKKGTSREVQPELRQLVFVRDFYSCQKCGEKDNLHCHHITGVEQNPIESADVDNCITLCKECHKEMHRLPGCGYHELRRCV